MKKSILYIVGIIAMMAISCTNETLVNESTTFRIMGGVEATSRTTFVDDGNVTHTHWVADDAIGLFSDTQSNLMYTATTSGATTEFISTGQQSLQREDGTKVYAYYPYTHSCDGDVVRLPYTLGQSSENPPSAFLYSEATISGNELHLGFRHLYAYLKLTITAKDYRDNIWEGDNYTYEGGGIYITSTECVSTYSSTFNVKTHEITHGDDCKRIIYRCPDIDPESESSYTYFIPILPVPENTVVEIHTFYKDVSRPNYLFPTRLLSKVTPEGGLKAGHVYSLSTTNDVVVDETQLEALADFYQAMGGSGWHANSNWLSDKPLRDWYGLNNSNENYGYVKTLILNDNNLTGTLPASFATLMNHMTDLNLNDNHLSGTIPEEMKSHERWNKLGWGIVHQHPEAGFDLTDSRLQVENVTVNSLINTTETALYDLFATNKLTQVIIPASTTSNGLLRTFDVSRVNLHLDYQSKGLGTLIYTGAEAGTDNEDLRNLITSMYGELAGVDWLYGYPPYSPTYNWSSYVFDSTGQLIYIAPYTENMDNTASHEAYAEFLHSYLGEPDTSHPVFGFDYYTSTDYSRDGEIFNIHSATVGKGIDLVFMGEAFVDKDMEPGGKYERKMKEAFDKLFSIEPYSRLKNRFNAYGVKVVSPHAEWTEGAKHRIDDTPGIALDLSLEVPMKYPKVIVVYNTDEWVDRSHCFSWTNGTFVAFCMDGVSNTLIHEVGGHGLGHLADEYVEGGNEDLTLPDERKESLDNSHTIGFYVNVDYNSTPEAVHWAHLLADERFDGEDLDIYEGAYLYGYGAFRPSENSMMRYNIGWFNAPSRESIYKAIMSQSVGEGWTYNYEDFVAFDEPARTESRSLSKPLTDTEKREILERHCPPIMIQGNWRDLLKHKDGNIVVPIR